MKSTDKKLPVIEIFGPTIQGEGPHVGERVMFIRFGLCDMKCARCDSMHAVDPNAVKKHAKWLTQDEIFVAITEMAEPSGTSHVVLSGGNPCIHDLTHLVGKLRHAGWDVSVETQGTKAPAWLSLCTTVVVSPKSPGMGEEFDAEVFRLFHLSIVNTRIKRVALKVVIFDQMDIEFAVDLFTEYDDLMPFLSLGNVYQPYLDDLDMRCPKNNIVDLRHELLERYRILIEDVAADPRLSKASFLPQLHVLVWGNAQEV